MAKRKEEEAGPGSPAWMSTFSDLMNLLLCFFVLLFSMSSIDSEKFQQLASALASSFSILPAGGSTVDKQGVLVSSGASQLNALSEYYNSVGLNTEGEVSDDVQEGIDGIKKEGLAESEKMSDYIEGALKSEGVSDKVDVVATSEYVILSLNGSVLFDSGKAELKDEAVLVLDKVSDVLKVYDDHVILIEGHTDNVPINTEKFPNNMMLSLYRAYAVFDYMVEEKGFNPYSLSSSGRGEAVPVASNSTAEGRAQNRRVEIKIYNALFSELQLKN